MARLSDITVTHEMTINSMLRVAVAVFMANMLTFVVVFFCLRSYIHYSVESFIDAMAEQRKAGQRR
jgi:hypothetical protein